jgi:hypothetical protein
VVLRLLRGESLDGLSRELGGEVYRLEKWREKALVAIDVGLKKRDGDPLKAELIGNFGFKAGDSFKISKRGGRIILAKV